jgi:hypothetical protein
MENLDQIQLLYINFFLLMFTCSIALYLPRKMQAINHKPKPHPEFIRFYKVLNQSLQVFQPKLIYRVDQMPVNEFPAFYKGLKYLHGFQVSLQATRLDNGAQSEYLTIDLSSYMGPRKVEIIFYEETRPVVAQKAIPKPNYFAARPLGNIISFFTESHPAAGVNSQQKVVDLASYRKSKVISYLPGGNEGA